MIGNSVRILHIAPTPFFSDRGCHIRIAGIISSLNSRGFVNHLCTYHHGADQCDISISRISPIGNYRDTSAGPNSGKYWADVKLLMLSLKRALQYKPHIIQSHLHEGALIGWIIKILLFWRRIKLVSDFQGSLTGELQSYGYINNNGLFNRLFWIIEAVILRLPDKITISSAENIKTLSKTFGVDSEKFTLIQDGFELDDFLDLANTDQLIDQYTQLKNKIIIVFTGSLLPAKGLNTLVKIIQSAVKTRSDIHFLLVGYPVNECRDLLESCNLLDRCTLTGRVGFDHLPEYLSLAHIALDPKDNSSGEASGKIINYMASGLPVICFDTENNRKLIGNSSCLCPHGDLLRFNSLLAGLLDNINNRTTEGARNKARAESLFRWDITTKPLSSIYSRITSS